MLPAVCYTRPASLAIYILWSSFAGHIYTLVILLGALASESRRIHKGVMTPLDLS